MKLKKKRSTCCGCRAEQNVCNIHGEKVTAECHLGYATTFVRKNGMDFLMPAEPCPNPITFKQLWAAPRKAHTGISTILSESMKQQLAIDMFLPPGEPAKNPTEFSGLQLRISDQTHNDGFKGCDNCGMPTELRIEDIYRSGSRIGSLKLLCSKCACLFDLVLTPMGPKPKG